MEQKRFDTLGGTYFEVAQDNGLFCIYYHYSSGFLEKVMTNTKIDCVSNEKDAINIARELCKIYNLGYQDRI